MITAKRDGASSWHPGKNVLSWAGWLVLLGLGTLSPADHAGDR
jgi:hypothetical protein